MIKSERSALKRLIEAIKGPPGDRMTLAEIARAAEIGEVYLRLIVMESRSKHARRPSLAVLGRLRDVVRFRLAEAAGDGERWLGRVSEVRAAVRADAIAIDDDGWAGLGPSDRLVVGDGLTEAWWRAAVDALAALDA